MAAKTASHGKSRKPFAILKFSHDFMLSSIETFSLLVADVRHSFKSRHLILHFTWTASLRDHHIGLKYNASSDLPTMPVKLVAHKVFPQRVDYNA